MPAIAVIGASSNRQKFGNRCVRAYRDAGWTVYPVHPSEASIEGIPVFQPILSVPAGYIDRVSVYLPPALGIGVLGEIARRGQVGEVMLNPGADGPEVMAEAARLGLPAVSACSLVALGE